MDARSLFAGDTFVNMAPEDWADLSQAQRDKIKPQTVLTRPEECATDRARVHFRCSAGTWCIPNEAPVLLLAG